jgi:26S proteasome regulatory subunit N2
LSNMSRVLPAQLKYISFPGSRYVPVKKVGSIFYLFKLHTNTEQPTGGVILLHDTMPEESKDLLELKVKKTKVAPGPTAESTPSDGGPVALFGNARTPGAAAVGASGGFGGYGDGSEEDVLLGAALAASRREAEERQRQEGSQRLELLDESPEGEADMPGDFEYFSENDDDRMEE